MPRTSGEASRVLELVNPGNVEVVKRLRAPDELTEEQKAEFSRVVGQMPADWFTPGNTALLCQYCRHVVVARQLGQLIERKMKAKGRGREGLESLIHTQQSESRVIAKLMTSLRLTPQAIAPKQVSENKARKVTNPWGDDE